MVVLRYLFSEVARTAMDHKGYLILAPLVQFDEVITQICYLPLEENRNSRVAARVISARVLRFPASSDYPLYSPDSGEYPAL